MIAIDPPVRILFEALASEGPSTHEPEPNYDPAWRSRAGVNNSDRMGAVSNDHRGAS